MKFFDYVKAAFVAGRAVAVVFGVLEILGHFIFWCDRGYWSSKFLFQDFIYFGALVAMASLAVVAFVALMALIACFFAEVCKRKMPALEAFFENIARVLVEELRYF